MNLRPTTNLAIPPELKLDRKRQRQGFMHIYTGAYTGSATTFMTRLWASFLFPTSTSNELFGTSRRRYAADEHASFLNSGYLILEKIQGDDPHFLARVPLFHCSRMDGAHRFLDTVMCDYRNLPKIPVATPNNIAEREGFAQLNTLDIPPQIMECYSDNTNAALAACWRGIEVRSDEGFQMVRAIFRIEPEEAQHLCTSQWSEIRVIDLYPLLMHWIQAGFGDRHNVPRMSIPVSKIVFSLPPSHVEEARINKLGLATGPDGRAYFLPREVPTHQTLTYEDLYTKAGQREDGTFALLTLEDGKKSVQSGKPPQTKLPQNVVVSIDWLNAKYAYTGTNGLLHIEDLTRHRPTTPSHVRQLLDNRKISDSVITWFINLASAVSVKEADFTVTDEDLDGLSYPQKTRLKANSRTIRTYYQEACRVWIQKCSPIVMWSALFDEECRIFAPLLRWFQLVCTAAGHNIDVVYTKYSVSNSSANLAWLLMVCNYGPKLSRIREMDVEARAPALNQFVDPDWKLKPIPLMMKEFGHLPHQLKVHNILRDDPDTAILPVQTGGGKSPLIIVDVLKHYDAGTDAPYIILCPNHLVHNYVNEILHFTEGRLNVVALTNTAITQNGWPRLQQIFESMPRNTVVVADLDYALGFRSWSVAYGTTQTTIYPTVEFLRQFRFGYCAIDEAHRMRGNTGRNKTIMAFIPGIKKIRLASGTFCHDSPSDLARVVGALNPTIFGTRDEFNNEFGDQVRGDRVVRWKPGAQRLIMARIREHAVVASAMRKEWAAFLPPKEEWVGARNLTDAQQAVYESILNEVEDNIREAAKTNPILRQFLERAERRKGLLDEEGNVLDEDEGMDLAGMLNPYLARLESFLVSPGRDELGKQVLTGADLVSPKVNLVYERLRMHFAMFPKTEYGNKVLIFVNFWDDAQEIFENAPEDLKKMGLLYKAADKIEAIAIMEQNRHIRWMVGIVKSMEEGLNLQFANRIIRVSLPWGPGALEQANARIERPQFKRVESRAKIFFDNLLVNNTFDITKQARLIAKVIAAAKFENAESEAYQEIPDMDVLSMTLETIREFRSWSGNGDTEGLMPYLKAQQQYEKVRNADYAEYKAEYIRVHGEGPNMQQIVVAVTPSDAYLMREVPWVPGLNLWNEKGRKITRLDSYLNVQTVDYEEVVEEVDD